MQTIKTIKTKLREEDKQIGCMWHSSSSDDPSVCIPTCLTSLFSHWIKSMSYVFLIYCHEAENNQRDLFNSVEKKQKQTQISSVLKAPHPIATLLSPPILITFAGFLGGLRMIPSGTKHVVEWVGGWYCFYRKAPLSISETNSQQSRVPTPINPT